jgi:blue copper oxidase
MRILNGSNARTYKLAWSNNMPMQVIGTDGGLLPAVEFRSYVMLMPGERVDVWADFTQLARKQVFLRSLTFNPGMGMGGGGGGMGGGGMGGGGMGGVVWVVWVVVVAAGAAWDPACQWARPSISRR